MDVVLGDETRCFGSIFEVPEDQTTVERITIHRTYLYTTDVGETREYFNPSLVDVFKRKKALFYTFV